MPAECIIGGSPHLALPLQLGERLISLHRPAGSTKPAPAPEDSGFSRQANLLEIPVPDGVAHRGWFLGLLSTVWVVACLGVQGLLAALLLKDPPPNPQAGLSDWGVLYVHPEYDVVLYVAGVASTVGLLALAAWLKARRSVPAGAPEPVLARLVAGAAGTGAFLWQFLGARADVAAGRAVPGTFLLVAGAAALTGIATILLPAKMLSTRLDRRLPRMLEAAGDAAEPRLRFSPLELLVPVALAALVYVPDWRGVAGRVFLEENFLHWDYFIMGPALSFLHGHALGTEIYSAYGLGWPMVFAAVSSWLPLSYGRLIQVGSVYACAYLLGIYLLLRVLGVRALLAAAGTLLAFLPFFLWMYGLVIWRTPNVTPLRWAFDVWCLLALALHHRSGRTGWAVAAGTMLGLAVLFAIDTGLELTVPFAFYWLWTLWAGRGGRAGRDLAASAATAAVVFLAGAAVASRGTMLTPSFWTGWLEAVLEFGGGFGMLPIATWPPGSTVAGFALVVLFYLVVTGYAVVRMLARRIGTTELFAGVLSLYGLVVLVKFLGHSDVSIFPRHLTPLAIVVTLLAGRALAYAGPRFRERWAAGGRPERVLKAVPAAVLLLAVATVAAVPRSWLVEDFLDYPGWLSARLSGPAPEGQCLMLDPRDICGLPPDLPAEGFRQMVAELNRLKEAGNTFAVIDETGSLFYLATGTAPFGRYSRIFLATHTKELVNDVKESLAGEAPDYILVRTKSSRGGWGFEQWNSFGLGPDPLTYYLDTWEAMDEVIRQGYSLDRDFGAFELWRRTGG